MLDAYSEGYRAYTNGGKNHYRRATYEWREWNRGRDDAELEVNRETITIGTHESCRACQAIL